MNIGIGLDWNMECENVVHSGIPSNANRSGRKYNVQVVELLEIRWSEEGSVASENMVFMYGGNKNNKHENGVGFMTHKSMTPQIIKVD